MVGRTSIVSVILAGLALAGGCEAPMISADDTILTEGGRSPIRVVAWRPGLVQFGRRIPDVGIVVYVDGKEVYRGKTNREGYMDVDPRFPEGATRFEARAVIDGTELSDTARVFKVKGPTIVVVDIDQTISNTDYDSLLSGEDDDLKSQPLPDAPEVLHRIAEDFTICYLTARPRELLDKTKRWLRTHKFPAAPVVSSESLGDVMNQQKYKQTTIAEIKDSVPHVLIGIGDSVTDSEAYGASGMLTLVLTEEVRKGFRMHGILLPNWKAVGRFFEANRKVLRDPERLEKVLAETGMLSRPVNPWTPPK